MSSRLGRVTVRPGTSPPKRAASSRHQGGRRRGLRRSRGARPAYASDDRGRALLPAAQLARRSRPRSGGRRRSRRPGRRAPRPRPGSAWSAGSWCRPRRASRISSQNSRRASGSKPVVGSSRKSSSGRPMMPSATSRRRFWPPERVWVRAFAFSLSPTRSITSSGSSASGRSRRSGGPPRRPVSSSNSPVPCSTMPTRDRQCARRRGPGRRRGRVTSPASRRR